MLCKKPFMAGAVPFGCGQCLPCRINRRRQWMWRQYLEALCHEENCFVTLTYSEEHLPKDGSLQPDVVSGFLKRLRSQFSGRTIRYFLVGEYGDLSLRPHYHLSLFGVSAASFIDLGRGRYRTLPQVIERSWKLGFIQVAEFNELTAQYVAGYVTKKLTSAGDPRLGGRRPEFARMSTRPGLGYEAVQQIARQLTAGGRSLDEVLKSGDVPRELMIGKRKIPLGRYLLRKLREAVGFSDEYSKSLRDSQSFKSSVELLAMFKDTGAFTTRAAYLESSRQKILNTEGRALLFKKKVTL